MALTVARVQVTTTAALLSAGHGLRRSGVIFNNGPNAIAIGIDSTLTMANGFLIPAGASLTLDHLSGWPDIWAICSVLQATPADTGIVAEFA